MAVIGASNPAVESAAAAASQPVYDQARYDQAREKR
jgi:hypothetical protein